MSGSLILACCWAVLANVIAMFPSRRNHWPAAYVLIALGIPIVGLVTWKAGPMAGVLVLAAGASILRWPLIYLARWVRRTARAPRPEPMAHEGGDQNIDPV